MKRIMALVLASLLLVSTMATGAAFAQQSPTSTPTETPANTTQTQQENTTTDDSNESNVTANNSNAPESPPGLQIAATVGAIGQDMESSFERFVLGHRLQEAETKEQRKQIINNFVQKQEKELEDKSANAEKRKNNTSARAQYEAAMDVVSAHNANESAEVAKQYAQKYNVSVNQTALNQLKSNARNLTGQQVSAIARSLVPHAGKPDWAGPNQKPPMAGGPSDKGPQNNSPDANQNRSDTDVNASQVETAIQSAEVAISEAQNNSSVSNNTVTEAEETLADAKETFSQAQNASGESQAELLAEAYELAQESVEILSESDSDKSEPTTSASGEQKGNSSRHGA